MWWLAVLWLEDRFPAGSPYPRGGVAPLRHDLELARYLEKQRAREEDASTTWSILDKTAAVAPTEEKSHGIGFGIADAFTSKS